MYVSCPGKNLTDIQVTVEWTDDNGIVLGKTVSVTDVFPRRPRPDVFPTATPNAQATETAPAKKPDSLEGETSICQLCGLSFKNPRGLRTHFAKRHPIEANQMKISSILKNKNPAKRGFLVENSATKEEISQWASSFHEILKKAVDINRNEFDSKVDGFLKFLRTANHLLPGPKHPAVRYFNQRKKNRDFKKPEKGESQVSNPARANKAVRARRQEAYQYELAQYNYYNRRKKVVRNIMDADAPKQCPISLLTVEEHFKKTLGEPNYGARSTYEMSPTNPDVRTIDIKSVHRAIKSTSLDTSPGPDGVLIRTVKSLDVAHIIKTIAEIMLKSSYVPDAFSKGRTVLIYKGKGSPTDISSWRPITIFSIIRRVIEKALDDELRNQVRFHKNQRGFIRGLPGCHVNARSIDAILKDAKMYKKSAVVTLLDVIGAFDNIGHDHITKSLESKGVSADLRSLITVLLSGNTLSVSVGASKTGAIRVCRGVPQGGPLSPTLFNVAVDFIYRELCDPALANRFGYKLTAEAEGIILTGFADDKAVTTPSVSAAERVVDRILRLLREIGLQINPRKSAAVIVESGILVKNKLQLENGDFIQSVGKDETIKYLGCTFSGELVVNEKSIQLLNENLKKLTTSNLLKPDQKLNVINQYIFPTLTYPLQTAPLTQLSPTLLEGVDVVIRRSAKAIVGLPANATSSMIYAPRRYRGLGLMKCVWEAPLQHLAIAQKLANVRDTQFQQIFDYEAEINQCAARLNIDAKNLQECSSVKKVRQSLREEAFHEWANCKWQGIGVIHFKDNPKLNKFIYDKQVLSASEWTNSLKLNMNYAPLRGVPGSAGLTAVDVGPLCRRCGRETETPAHVLGICPHNMLLVTRRHHRVKHAIMESLKSKNYTCFEEVYGVDEEGSTRYADIIAFEKDSRLAYILDPTIRFETNDPEQAKKVDLEKRSIYEKCIPYYSEKYREEFGERDFLVRGLWFGSRGSISKETADFLNQVAGIDLSALRSLAEEIILDSLAIISHHIYQG